VKSAIAAPRRVKAEMPEIYARVKDDWRSTYAKANIRVKAGKYLYLAWRENGTIRNFYD
jgi:sRNA-binding carbon storage regulator CsrA